MKKVLKEDGRFLSVWPANVPYTCLQYIQGPEVTNSAQQI